MLLIGVVSALFLISRLLTATISKKSRDSIRKWPILHGFCGLVSLVLIGVTLPLGFPHFERTSIAVRRDLMVRRIQEGGGWGTFEQECKWLLNDARASGRTDWTVWETNNFSVIISNYPVVRSLEPVRLHALATTGSLSYVILVLQDDKNRSQPNPYYALVYQEALSNECVAAKSFERVSPKKITDSVFEMY